MCLNTDVVCKAEEIFDKLSFSGMVSASELEHQTNLECF